MWRTQSLVSNHLQEEEKSELLGPGELGCPGSQIRQERVLEAGQGDKPPKRTLVKQLTKERPRKLKHLCSKCGE